MNLNEHIAGLARARYSALDKIVQGQNLVDAGKRELASIDSMINLAKDLQEQQEAEKKEDSETE